VWRGKCGGGSVGEVWEVWGSVGGEVGEVCGEWGEVWGESVDVKGEGKIGSRKESNNTYTHMLTSVRHVCYVIIM
jgi:hypothetical protein